MTSGGPDPSRRLFPPLEPERPRQALRVRWLAILLAVLVASAAVVAVLVTMQSRTSPGRRGSSPRARTARLPSAAIPLPGAAGRASPSFGVLRHLVRHAPEITRQQALERYDHMTGVVDRHSPDRRVFTALVSAAYLDRGQRAKGTFWIVSVWFHPASIGVSPQHQWCVNHGLIDAATGATEGHIDACLPVGEPPRPVR